jgi:hypothetical protein
MKRMPVQTQSEIVTHGVGLWLQNDEGFYHWAKEQIELHTEDLDYDAEDSGAATIEVLDCLAADIEGFFDCLYEEASDDLNPIFREFIADSLNAIAWDDLAKYYEDEVRQAVSEALAST